MRISDWSSDVCSSDLAQAVIDERTALVAGMLVNNEIGVIQPVDELRNLAAEQGALFFCVAVQGYGRAPMPADPDMVAISGHKISGPKGVGPLWLREGLELPPLIYRGGQAQGLRSGTISPALCVGLGVAATQRRAWAGCDAAHVEAPWRSAGALV